MTLSENDIKKIRPLSDRVVIKRVSDEGGKTPGGIFIPDQAKEKAQIGKVLAVGPGKILTSGAISTMHVKEGDTVFFGKYSGTEVGEQWVIVREDEILGVL